MSGEIAGLRLKATRKRIDGPLPDPEVDYERRLAEYDRRIEIYLLMIKRDDISTDRKRQAIVQAEGIVRQYIGSVPQNQQERYVRGNLTVVNMVASINSARAEVLGGRK